jgi:hypothetical protein
MPEAFGIKSGKSANFGEIKAKPSPNSVAFLKDNI